MSMVGTFAIKAISTFKLMMKSTCLSLLQESTSQVEELRTSSVIHQLIDQH